MFRNADYVNLADHGTTPIVPYAPELDDLFTRFNFASDLHQDFEGMPDSFFIEHNAPNLIIAGDAGEAKHYQSTAFQTFFERCSEHWQRVFIIAGNHEHYGSPFTFTVDKMREALQKFENITVLDNGYVELDNVIVLGGTLWTNFNNEDTTAMAAAQWCMNDYRTIKSDTLTKPITPHRTFHEHQRTMEYFKKILEQFPDKSFVVVSHHAPSLKSVDPDYVDEPLLNYAYASDLEEFILAHPNIIHWIHGHMHTRKRYNIGDTTIHVHARGYPNQFPDYRTYEPKELFV